MAGEADRRSEAPRAASGSGILSAHARSIGPHTGSDANGTAGRNGTSLLHDPTLGRVGSTVAASPTANAATAASPTLSDEDRLALSRKHRVYRQIVKPAADRAAAACLLVLFAPVIAAVAAGVRLRLGRGTVFRQKRIGLDGGEFTIYKFRTMAPDRRRSENETWFDGADRRTTHKSENDPRHTGFGRLLRKYSLDELPQLFNVLRGDMSLVGPRPELVDVAVKTGIVDHPRHLVRPGLTGPWQISPARGQLIVDGLDLDLTYVETCGPLTDLRLLVLTVPAVLRRTGS